MSRNGHKVIKTLADLTPDPANARKHNPRNVGMLVDSLHQVGAARSIVVDEDGVVLAGNATIEAAAEAGIHKVRSVEADGNEIIAVVRRGLTKEQKTKLALYDNRVAELAEWNPDILAELVDTDVLAGMFSDKELAEILTQTGVEPKDAEPQIDKAEELRQKWSTETGQLWVIGNHRLLVGDATNKADVGRVCANQKASACITDPPYGIDLNYDKFQDSKQNVKEMVTKWLPIAREVSKVVVFSPGVTRQWLYPEPDWVFCWFYGGGQFRSPWGFNCWQPFICYGKDPSLAVGQGCRPDAVDMNSPANAGDIDHPCPKPLALIDWLINRLTFSDGEVIYDPFIGSGTTLVAAENLNRKCYAIEISPAYVAVCLERMSNAFPHLKIEKAEQARAA